LIAKSLPATAICETCTDAEPWFTSATEVAVVWPVGIEPNDTLLGEACSFPEVAVAADWEMNEAPPHPDNTGRRIANPATVRRLSRDSGKQDKWE